MEHLLRYATLALLEQREADLRDILKLFVCKGSRRQAIVQIESAWRARETSLTIWP